MNRHLLSILSLVLLLEMSAAISQDHLAIPDDGWRLWLDREAKWESDSIFLPDEVDLTKLPLNPPSGGWSVLTAKNGISVTLPSTVEEHFWGVAGFRKYKDEYFYESDDTLAQNGNYLGVSWWWREIDVPRSFDGKKIILFVRGARLRAEVYLNRQLVGYNIITEVSFTCDVSNAIQPGKKNQIAIRITNPGGRLDWLDTQLMSWGTTSQRFHKSHGFGGLDRGMTLTAYDPVHITDLWVLNTPDERTIKAYAKIRNTTRRLVRGTLLLEVLGPAPSTNVCAATSMKVDLLRSSDSTIQAELAYDDAKLWSLISPTLYRLRATLVCPLSERYRSKSKNWKDVRDRVFGFRWFEADSVGKSAVLRLNGDRVRLTSAISWGFWGRNGLFPTPELAEREVKAAKTFGMNCIQFHRIVGKTEVLDVHDRLGVMRYMEPGGGQTALGEKFNLYAPSPTEKIDDSGRNGDPQTFYEKYMEEKIVRMIRDHRSHPSLVMYAVQNEFHPDLKNPRVFRVLRRMHEEDPSRIVVLKSGFPSGKPSVNQAWMQPYNDAVMYDTGDGCSGWWDDHTVGGPGVWRDEMYRNPDDFTHRSTNEKEIVVWGEMLGAAVPDNHAAMVRELKSRGSTSYDLKDHEEILAAFERFLDRWGFRQAFPTADALFTSIGNKSYDFWGRVVETARLAEANDYFVMSGWESTSIENHSGLLDNLRGFKGDPTLISTRLAPLRPVIKTKSLVYSTGERITLDVFLLNETNQPHGSQIRVWLTEPSGKQVDLRTYDIPPHEKDRFVYPVATGVSTQRFDNEGTIVLHAAVIGDMTVSSEERVLIIDPVGKKKLPQSIGIISDQPALRKSFELFPDVEAEPYREDKEYDVIVAANRIIRPLESSVESTRTIQGTEDQELCRSIHYGSPDNFDYVFSDLPEAKAKVTLKFAELFQNAPGVRVFDVAINGTTMLKNFDVWSAAGGKDIAFDTVLTTPVIDGTIQITVPKVSAGSARIAAIKIETGDSVVAINCGGKQYVDKNGLLWKPYEPSIRISEEVIARVKNGTPLIVLAEGSVATEQYARQFGEAGAFTYLGRVGEARASWMGSWYFVREHPLYEGLPVNRGMDSYYQVPVTNADAVLLDGDNVEVVAGYSRDHDRNIGAGSFTAKLGNGSIVFHCIPGVVSALTGESTGMHPTLVKRLVANSLRFVAKE